MKLEIFNIIAVIVGAIGSMIIIWGVLITLFYFILKEIQHIKKKISALKEREEARFRFATYLLLGLDFILAADILYTLPYSNLDELYILAIIVAIRAVIGLVINKEMKESFGKNIREE